MNRILAFFFLLVACTAGAQNTDISGTALGRPGELVRVLVYADQFSLLDSTVAATETDVWGNYSLSFSLGKTEYAFLALGLKKGEFYIEPGHAYHALVRSDTVQGSVFDQLPLQFDLNEESGELNRMIGEFNFNYNTFILQYQKQLLRAKSDKLINDFINKEKIRFADELAGSSYFSDYMTYSFASLEWISKVKGGDTTILKEYFTNRGVLYENIAYTDLFRDFFKQYFKNLDVFDYPVLISALNKGELPYVDSLMQQDKWLEKDGRIRELALMLLLARNFYNKDVVKEKVLNIFAEIEKTGKYGRNRIIAGNFKRKLLKLNYGSKAPSFELKNAQGEGVTLDSFTGKFVLLNFITSACRPCLFNLPKMEEIQSGFGNSLEVLLIVSNGNMEKVSPFIKGSRFHLLDLENKILLLEDYEIKTYPTYIIINPDGTLAMAPAPLPDENLDVYIERFMKRYQDRNKEKVN